MRKYNIPLKEIKEVKQEIVECSSGGGEGVKEYYYKWLTDDIEGERMSIEPALFSVNSIILNIPAIGNFKMHCYINNGFGYPGLQTFYSEAFSIYGEEFCMLQSNEDFIYNVIPKGNIIDKLKSFGDEALYLIELVNKYLQEITKEEYEAMITYKP